MNPSYLERMPSIWRDARQSLPAAQRSNLTAVHCLTLTADVRVLQKLQASANNALYLLLDTASGFLDLTRLPVVTGTGT